MDDSQINELTKQAERDNSEHDAYVWRCHKLLGISYLLEKPMGIFIKRCPKCRTRLECNKFPYINQVGFWHKHFSCPACDYEYCS